jgi:hypothetical protein
MSFLPQTLRDGSPNPSAMFINALLCQGLYRESTEAFLQYARISESTLQRFDAHKETFRPDTGILMDSARNQLVIFDGTTNAPQWVAHVGSCLFPAADMTLDIPAVGSFYVGEGIIEPDLFRVTDQANGAQLLISGHSYGAAAANIFAHHLTRRSPGPASIDLMTFGEPYSFGEVSLLPRLDSHNRIIAAATENVDPDTPDAIDPVTLVPPPSLTFLKLNPLLAIPLTILGIRWKHSGTAWYLTVETLKRAPDVGFVTDRIPYLKDAEFVSNLPFINQHLMGSSYLPKALDAWQRSGMNRELAALLPLAYEYIGIPVTFPVNLHPPVAAEVINDGFGLEAGTFTDANRLDWSTVSASAILTYPEGAGPMPITPYVQPTLKGTLFFDQDEGGSSESVFAAPPNAFAPSIPPGGNAPASYGAMFNAMKNFAQARLRLSQTADNPLCNNPLVLKAIRVDNQQVNRDSLLSVNPGINGPGYTGGQSSTFGIISNENDDIDAAYHCTLNDGNGHNASLYFHGVPLWSQNVAVPPGGLQPPSQFLERVGLVSSGWTQAMNNLCNVMIAQGLGFRFAYPTWTQMGAPTNGYNSTGNGTPIAAYYNFPGTPNNTYTFQMPLNPTPPGGSPPAALCQNPLGKFVIIIRGMQLLKVINGRWSAVGFMYAGSTGPTIPAGYYVNVRRRAANYLTTTAPFYDSFGYLAPEVWSVVQPAPAPPIASAFAPGITGPQLTSKKVGRPFDLQRGRRRATVV